jgi:hypothetical protein
MEDAMLQVSGRTLLHGAALAVAVAGTLFWLYTFYAIAQMPMGDGSGFQWVAVMPLGTVFLLFTFPALTLVRDGRRLWLALILGLNGLGAFALMWYELLSAFYQ